MINRIQYTMFMQLTRATARLPVMSETIDQIVELAILRFFKPRRLIEFGAATGNWCIIMNGLCNGYVDQHYTLVEDFSWHTNNHTGNKSQAVAHNFPKNKTELTQHVSKHIRSFDIIDTSVDQLIKTDLEEPVDLVRIDCDIDNPDNWNKTVEWIDRNGSDRLIILSDDIKSTVAPHRMLIMQQLVAEGKMNLMWIGEDTAAWCRPTMLNELHKWVEYVYSFKESELMNIFEMRLQLYGYKQKYIHTNRSNLYEILIPQSTGTI